ncbi:cathepsin B-like [Helicoverpa zea]|uniref:cathepsin B-like n=1 Tax=Helicoverpa zea TaxID=7113 RepID=UPI001F581325|nr:cathepsin B-like [Helicoverpa zea]
MKTTMAALNVTLIVIVCAISTGAHAIQNPFTDNFINQINSRQNSWKAGRNFPLHISIKFIKNLAGTIKDAYLPKLPQMKHGAELIGSLPDNFDPREKWPHCPSLNEIRDQGACASCWAFGGVEAMTDRYCIHSNGTEQFHFSAQDLINCCETCGLGCIRGVHTAAWLYWKQVGLVSGGNYKTNDGCKSYKIPPGLNGTSNAPYFKETVDASQCVTTCDSNFIDYRENKRHGKNAYSIGYNEDQIKLELFKNGPVESVMAVYTDFLSYKNGVYNQTQGHLLGHHAVKILGWGVENGHKYWLVANSWNQHWGDKGFFKILRGVNHCGIEDSVVAGEPIIV